MAETITSGVVLKRRDYGEHDQIITILTQSGLLSFIALGTRKITSKNRVALDIGNIIEIEYFRARLTNKLSKLKKAHLIKRAPIEVGDTAKVLLEIIKEINKLKEPSENIYEKLLGSYSFLGKGHNQNVRTYILFNILKEHGIEPIMNRCAEGTETKNIIDFKLYRGGFLCQKHSKDNESLKILQGWRSLSNGLKSYLEVAPEVDKNISDQIKKYLLTVSY